ncbi:MAG: efflux RND transporter permease subunit, partial [Cyanobacteria bacterium P01_D01_bin.44]
VTPMMAARLLQPQPLEQHQPPRPQRCTANGTPIPRVLAPYYGLLNAALRHRFLTLAVAIAFFSLSLTLVRFIPTSLYSAGDTALSTLSVKAPPSYTLQKTEALTQTLADQFLEHPAVDSVYVSHTETEARVVVRLKPKPQRDITRQDFEQQMRQGLQNFPDLRFSFDSEGPGGSDKALNIVFKGKNPTALTQTADQLVQQMRQMPGLVEVSSSASLVKPELLILPDREQAANLGVSVRDIATIPLLTTLGDTDANLANFDLGDRQIPIRVRLGPEFMTDISTLQTLKIPSQSGQLIPLSAVANIAMGSSPAQIERFDRSRQVTVSANLQGITLGQGLDAVYALPLFQNLPTGVTQQTAGDADIMQEVFGRFTLALGTAIVMIYAVLVLLYESFIYPLAVMAALPLSVGGTLLGLMIAQKPLDLFALIGIVLLMGLVTKNSILLVDYALMMGRRGLSLKQAVIEAGVTRLRPILMTSISTIAGMVPIALELGAGGNTRSPMAIAVIGGFSTATLLTLIVIPVCFTYVVGLRKTLNQIWSLFNSRFQSRSKSFTQRPEISPNPSTLPDASPQLKLTPAEFPSSQSKPWGNSVPEVTSLTPQRQSTMVMEAAPLETASLEISPHSKPNSDSAVQVVTQVTVPATVPATKSEPESPVTAQAAGQCCFTVACIEDDFSSLCSIYQYLDETIFSIVSVEDPAVALTDLVKYQPDVILLSLSMPDVDGYEICSRLRKNPAFQGASIILLSDQYRWVQRLRAKLCGASAYLVKPVSRTQLLTKLFLLLV